MLPGKALARRPRDFACLIAQEQAEDELLTWVVHASACGRDHPHPVYGALRCELCSSHVEPWPAFSAGARVRRGALPA